MLVEGKSRYPTYKGGKKGKPLADKLRNLSKCQIDSFLMSVHMFLRFNKNKLPGRTPKSMKERLIPEATPPSIKKRRSSKTCAKKANNILEKNKMKKEGC